VSLLTEFDLSEKVEIMVIAMMAWLACLFEIGDARSEIGDARSEIGDARESA
jgi:hypothetical protein